MSDQSVNDRSDTYFIVGAPRTGTKILRDTIKSDPSVEATEHNLNALWETARTPQDHHGFEPETLTEDAVRRIRSEFRESFDDAANLLEKNTCHSLRMDYVDRVFPDAKFIHIYRHPYDAISSARKRWQNPFEWQYFLSSKIFEIPISIVPGLILKQAGKYAQKFLGGRKHVGTWGPLFSGIQEMAREVDLLTVCSYQWKYCVEGVKRFAKQHPDRVLEISYERLMDETEDCLEPVARLIGLSDPKNLLQFARTNYRTNRIGRWKEELSGGEKDTIETICRDQMLALGYTPR